MTHHSHPNGHHHQEENQAQAAESNGHDPNEEEEEEEEDEEEEDEEFGDSFFESFDRVPSGISVDVNDLPSSSSDDNDDDADNVRISFASAVAPPSFRHLDLSEFGIDDSDPHFQHHQTPTANQQEDSQDQASDDYGVWMSEPMSVQDRRRKLLKGMGLTSSRNLKLSHKAPPPVPSSSKSSRLLSSRFVPPLPPQHHPSPSSPLLPTPPPPAAVDPTNSSTLLTRSRSDSHLPALSPSSPSPFAPLFRVSSSPPSQWRKWDVKRADGLNPARPDKEIDNAELLQRELEVVKIKNLDTGKEFVVSVGKGTVNKLDDPETGAHLTMDEFEKFLGYSPIVKEVMRRAENVTNGISTAIVAAKGAFTKGGNSKMGGGGGGKKKVSWLKNFKFGLMSEKEKEKEKEKEMAGGKTDSSGRLKVHPYRKPYKEFTGLYMCQEIQAHQGSIWTMKFSCDSRYLASAGEDRVVHVWQVIECDTMSSSLLKKEEAATQSPKKLPPLANGGQSTLGQSKRMNGQPSKKVKKGKGSAIPEYIVMPETVFSLSSEPFCSFEGHLDDILDLSWSKSQLLLSSSMDKTVRLWDIETKACLKLFAHNDYVTCIQFNPTDESYFISGSLDAKIRLWSIPDRHVIDWSDLHEMVTAVCYTPDGQGALVGSHKGVCRVYNTSDIKLAQDGQIDIHAKKKKNAAKKVTGFQFAPDNPHEVLITSADSQIRVYDGSDMIHKFRGFRNSSSQISASFTSDGKYVVCASEDSHVYIWKRDRLRTGPGAKGKLTTRSHEHFYCKDVSVAVPWPNGGTNCEPSPDLPHWSRRHERSPSNLEDMFPSGRSQSKKSFSENSSATPEEANISLTRSGSVIGSSFVSRSSSLRSGHSAGSSISSAVTGSSSSLSSWGWGGGGNRITSDMEEANAWGLVFVTAGLGGNIRVYQNFGLPLRLNNLF